jgi:hypothetical protein
MNQEFREPYFKPATDDGFLANGESALENNQQFRQSQKFGFFRNAIDYIIENDLSGAYFEFGVHRARTFTMAMSLDKFYSDHGLANGSLSPKQGGGYFDAYFAFDSFEGFPAGTNVGEHPLYKQGHVRTEELEFLSLLKSYGQNIDRVELIKGFYNESLTEELATNLRERKTKASLVTVDCNLYESYRDVLQWCDEFLLPGSVIYLDDFNTHRAQPDRGPRRAWDEYCSKSRWTFDRFLDVGWGGRSFVAQEG